MFDAFRPYKRPTPIFDAPFEVLERRMILHTAYPTRYRSPADDRGKP
jgi:hypothetical protein